MQSVRREIHDTGRLYEEADLGGYVAIFTDDVESEYDRANGATIQMHLSWKGKNPGVDTGLTLDDIARLRATLAKVARKARRSTAPSAAARPPS